MAEDDEVGLLEKDKTPKKKWKNSKIGVFQFWTSAAILIFSYLQVYALIGSLGMVFNNFFYIQQPLIWITKLYSLYTCI